MSETFCVDPGKLSEIVSRYAAGDAAALPRALLDLQAAFRHLPLPAVEEICRRLSVPLSRAFSVGTFHRAFSLAPKGEVVFRICTGAACHGRGAGDLVAKLCEDLGIAPGGTTKDLKFTVETMNCVGACAMAPVVSVNGDLRGNAGPDDLAATITEVRA